MPACCPRAPDAFTQHFDFHGFFRGARLARRQAAQENPGSFVSTLPDPIGTQPASFAPPAPPASGETQVQVPADGFAPWLFGADGFNFLDLLDVINPLQHIPFVSTLYRALTGDTIAPASRVAGGAPFGGPIGGGASGGCRGRRDRRRFGGAGGLAFRGHVGGPGQVRAGHPARPRDAAVHHGRGILTASL